MTTENLRQGWVYGPVLQAGVHIPEDLICEYHSLHDKKKGARQAAQEAVDARLAYMTKFFTSESREYTFSAGILMSRDKLVLEKKSLTQCNLSKMRYFLIRQAYKPVLDTYSREHQDLIFYCILKMEAQVLARETANIFAKAAACRIPLGSMHPLLQLLHAPLIRNICNYQGHEFSEDDVLDTKKALEMGESLLPKKLQLQEEIAFLSRQSSM